MFCAGFYYFPLLMRRITKTEEACIIYISFFVTYLLHFIIMTVLADKLSSRSGAKNRLLTVTAPLLTCYSYSVVTVVVYFTNKNTWYQLMLAETLQVVAISSVSWCIKICVPATVLWRIFMVMSALFFKCPVMDLAGYL
jgi:hypothetical protein